MIRPLPAARLCCLLSWLTPIIPLVALPCAPVALAETPAPRSAAKRGAEPKPPKAYHRRAHRALPNLSEEQAEIVRQFEALGYAEGSAPSRTDDVFHANSIQVLDGCIADGVPAFAANNVLLSFRTFSAIRVIGLEQRKLVWFHRGSFGHQHDANVLDNGNTLISESAEGRAFEVTPEGEIVWEFYNPHRAGENDEFIAVVNDMTRMPLEHTSSRLQRSDED